MDNPVFYYKSLFKPTYIIYNIGSTTLTLILSVNKL